MSTDPDRIVRLARGVLDDYERRDDWNKPRSRSGKEMPPYEVMFARAVIELTAERDAYREENTRYREKIARMEALADRLDRLAAWERTPPSGLATASPYADGLDEAAARIRTALNGENA